MKSPMKSPMTLSFLPRLYSKFLALPAFRVNLLIGGIAAFALIMALISQYVFGLHPCVLCLYQRVPFVVVIILSVVGSIFCTSAKPALWLSSLALFINACIAFFHSGVERKWWEGLTGCSSPDLSGSIDELMARIQNAPVARCDEIPWDLFGLSMANYNVALCLGLAVFILLYLKSKRA